MRLAVIKSRLAPVDERGAIDVAAVSAGKFSPSPRAIYEQWAHVAGLTLGQDLSERLVQFRDLMTTTFTAA